MRSTRTRTPEAVANVVASGQLTTALVAANSRQTSRIGFLQWMVHEPIAVLVICTLMSMAVQRASTRIENFAISPVVDTVCQWVTQVSSSGTDVSANQQKPGTPVESVATTSWQIQLVALIVDLILNVALIYIVYLMLVKGGLRPYFGTNRQ